MDLKERLKNIMAQEFGITTDEQLNEAYDRLDLSDFSVFAEGSKNED